MKITSYTVRASKTEAAKWAHWAREMGYRSTGRWLESLAVREARRLESIALHQPPPPDPVPGIRRRRISVSEFLRDGVWAPYMRLTGFWLARLGFAVGSPVAVTVSPGRIVLEAAKRL